MKKRIVASIIFFIVCIISTMIYAAIDAKVEINPSTSTVKPGDEVTFTIKVKDIVSENGANGIEGTIAYDTDVFESIEDSNVTKAGPWDVAYYNNKVIAEGLTAIKVNSDVINIKLKVKNDSNISGKTAKVEFKDTVVYNTEKVELGTVSTSVKVEGGSESTPTPSTTPGTATTNPTPTPTTSTNKDNGSNQGNLPITNIDTNTSGGTTKTSTSSTGTVSKTTSSNSIPKAGIGNTIAILLVLVAGIGIVLYIKLRKYKEI